MKRRVLAIVLAMVCALSMMACAKSKEQQASEYYQETLGLDKDDADELAKALYGEGDSTNEGKDKADPVDYKKFEPVAEWSDVDNLLTAIQIDDTLYTVGMTMGEFDAKLKASSVEYTYDDRDSFSYNPDALCAADGLELIKVLRDGNEVCTISCCNLSDSTISASEMIVTDIEIGTDYCPYTCILGKSVCGMSYNEVKEFVDGTNLFNPDDYDEYNSYLYYGGERTDGLALCYKYSQSDENGGEDAQLEIGIDSNTSKVIGYDFNLLHRW